MTHETSARGKMEAMLATLTAGKQVNSESIKSFFYQIMSKVGEKLTIDWVSMGIIIGKKGETITPFSLVDLETDDGPEQEHTTDKRGDDQKEFISFATLITGTFRICSASNATYENTLTTQLARVLEGSPFKDNIENAKLNLVDAYGDEELIKMFAILDMYFNMFPKSPYYAKIRVGTIILSYKDCSALASLGTGYSRERSI